MARTFVRLDSRRCCLSEPHLETRRLILRRITRSDVDQLFALDNDPGVMRFINGGTPTPRDVIEKDILPGFLQYDDRFPALGFWAAIEKTTGDFLGWFSFRPSDTDQKEAILGYRLHKAAWGKGYATEGACALIDMGFTMMGMQRVVATTYQDNLVSIRVMEKLGMRFVRAFRITPEDILNTDTYYAESTEVWDGEDVVYALEREEWARGALADIEDEQSIFNAKPLRQKDAKAD